MGLHANAVAGPVYEVLPVAGVIDDPTGRRVHVLARRAHRGCRHSHGLRLLQCGVQLCEAGRRPAYVHAACDVRAVAHVVRPGHGAADVEQHAFASPDDPVAGFVVGAGGVGAGRHDHEVHPVVALVQDPPADLGRHVGFGPPDQRHEAGLHVGQDSIHRRPRPAEGLHLGVVLHHPDGRRDLGRPAELQAGTGRREVDHEAGPGLVSDGRRGRAAHQVGHPGDRVLAVTPRDHPEHLGTLDHPGRLQVGDHQVDVAVTRHDQHGEALQRHGLVAAEVGQVGAQREEEDVYSLFGHGRPGPVDALAKHGDRLWGRRRPGDDGPVSPDGPRGRRARSGRQRVERRRPRRPGGRGSWTG